MIAGIDISQHQGSVNLDAIKNDKNIAFVILRAGYGGGGVDSQFKRSREGLEARGVPLGFYFFAYPGRSSGKAQAREFHSIVGSLKEGQFVALDIENERTYGRDLVSSDVQWSLEFLQEAERLFGVKPLVYMDGGIKSKFNWQPVVDGNYGLWIAHWGRNIGIPDSNPNPAPWKFWAIHQYTSRANMGGITPLDANRFNGSITELKKYGPTKGQAPTPAPAPAPAPPANTYIVQRGDSLSSIASRYGISWQELYEWNRDIIGSNPNLIKPGQVLRLRKSAAPANQYYTVVRGDSLSSIASRYGTTWQQLYEWNKAVIGSNPNLIKPGQRLRVK